MSAESEIQEFCKRWQCRECGSPVCTAFLPRWQRAVLRNSNLQVRLHKEARTVVKVQLATGKTREGQVMTLGLVRQHVIYHLRVEIDPMLHNMELMKVIYVVVPKKDSSGIV